MRIIGGHDYYDSALSYGHDAHTVFVRGAAELTAGEARPLGLERPRISDVATVVDAKMQGRNRRFASRRGWRLAK